MLFIFVLCLLCYIEVYYEVDANEFDENGLPLPIESKKTTAILPPEVKETVCMLIPQKGPCRAGIKMYYFEPEKLRCGTFYWGGCQGNGNRFNSNEECTSTCLRTPDTKRKSAPSYCQLSFDYGYCFGATHRWYYDRIWKTCKKHIYSGCGGNANNFLTLDLCKNFCMFGETLTWGAKEDIDHKTEVKK